MVLLRLLRYILFCGQDDAEERFYDYRTYRDYTPIRPPVPTSTSKLPNSSNTAGDQGQYRRYRDDDDRPSLPPARSNMDSRGNLKPQAVASHGGENQTLYSSTGTSDKPVTSTPFPSSVRVPLNPFPASKQSAPVLSTNITSGIKLSIDPEKLQITKDSATYSPVRPSAAPVPTKFQAPTISSPAAPAPAPAPSSKKPSLSTVSSTNQISAIGIASHGGGNQTLNSSTGTSEKPVASTPFPSSVRVPANPFPASKPSSAPVSSTNINTSGIKLSIDLEKLQITKASATCSPVRPSAAPVPSKFQAPTITSSAAPAPSSKKPFLSTLSSTNQISAIGRPVSREKLQISPEPATRTPDSISPTLQSKASLSTKLSSAPISTVNSSFPRDGSRVWRKKKKKQSSTASIGESQQNIFSQSLFSIKIPSHDSSSSGTSSPSPTPETRIISRRVLSKYEIPKYLEEMIKKDIVPPVLKSPLSPLTYGDYFATLLYAEDFYLEKWSKYLLEDVSLELRPRGDRSRAITVKRKNSTPPDRRDFVAFKLEEVPEKRPFLLSRDFVFLQPRNSSAEPFKGILFRVEKRVVLVEFGDDFHSQHSPPRRYDVSFSFNRVCLKRAHQAISIAADPSFHSILFPERSFTPNLHDRMLSFQDPARRIANHKGPIPFLLEGQLVKARSYSDEAPLSPTGRVLQLAMLNIYRANPRCRILVCSPTNNTSDVLLRSLRDRIPEAGVFRANAAFRDYDLVPADIVPASLYEEEQECFSCPPLPELLNFNIVTCTFMSSFRLSSAGIDSAHFSHIFLVDACLAIEPEAIVPLANLACGDTAVVVSGCSRLSPGWVRSEIARRNGLKVSYFSRLLEREPYRSGDAMFTLEVPDD